MNSFASIWTLYYIHSNTHLKQMIKWSMMEKGPKSGQYAHDYDKSCLSPFINIVYIWMHFIFDQSWWIRIDFINHLNSIQLYKGVHCVAWLTFLLHSDGKVESGFTQCCDFLVHLLSVFLISIDRQSLLLDFAGIYRNAFFRSSHLFCF